MIGPGERQSDVSWRITEIIRQEALASGLLPLDADNQADDLRPPEA